MDLYIKGATLETLERAKKLKEKIHSPTLDVYFNALAQKSEDEIDSAIVELEWILGNINSYSDESKLGSLFSRLKKLVHFLDQLEKWPIAALHRNHEDDEAINKLLDKIRREIHYPLTPPTVTCLSQQYYNIHPGFNLLSVPLLESDFLLHIPDLYHELAHPLISLTNNPKIEEFQLNLGRLIATVRNYFRKEIIQEKRKGSSQLINALKNWNYCWSTSWSVEFFCDLFGIYTVGPAFAWSHLHLAIKRGHENPFHFPFFNNSSHPPDHARMIVLLNGLDLIGLSDKRKTIEKKWNNYVNMCGHSKQPEFNRAFPDTLLETCSVLGLEAVKSIKCKLASTGDKGEIFLLLNEAWEKFWKDPDSYIDWEQEKINYIKSNI